MYTSFETTFKCKKQHSYHNWSAEGRGFVIRQYWDSQRYHKDTHVFVKGRGKQTKTKHARSVTICCNQLLFIVHIHHAVIKHREEVTVLSCKDDLMSSRWLAAGSAAWSGSCVHGRALHCSFRQTKREDYFETIAVPSKPYGFCGRKATFEKMEW